MCLQVWRAIQAVLPKEAIISTDIGNNCAIGNAYPSLNRAGNIWAPGMFGPAATVSRSISAPRSAARTAGGRLCRDGAFGISMNQMTSIGREGWPAITMVIFRNYQVGSGKRNTTLWYDNNFGRHRAQSEPELRQGCRWLRPQGRDGRHAGRTHRGTCEGDRGPGRGITTFVEVILNQESVALPRDAMKKPVAVAGIRRARHAHQRPM